MASPPSTLSEYQNFHDFCAHYGTKSEAAAIKRLAPAREMIVEEDLRWMIVVQDGRFAPVIWLPRNKIHLHSYFAARKVGVIG